MNVEDGLISPSILNDCWNKIGVEGDRSCPELKTVIHCRNCPVYSAAGRSLLEREAPPGYLSEWTSVLAESNTDQLASGMSGAIGRAAETISIIIFRLGDEHLALPVRLLQEVTHPCVIHTLPHRSNELFLGLVNIRGEILLCASLHHLLGLDLNSATTLMANRATVKRMLVVGREANKWVFLVDEVHGIYRFYPNELCDVPVVISKASEAYTKGVVHWREKTVNYLDADLLFYTLERRIL